MKCERSPNMKQTHLMNMHLLLLLLGMVMWDYTGMTAAQPHCDPLTEYEDGHDCCKMCGPGTKKSPFGTCLEPECTECGDNEYQDKYTKETKCQLQPYCDTNKNFKVPVVKTKKVRSSCVCKEGFHCSSRACITCIPHTNCPPGYEAQPRGNHTHDTVCKTCPHGTFSIHTAWDSVCQKWTMECERGSQLRQSGTDKSDNICEITPRNHVVGIAVGSVFAVLLFVAVLVFLLFGVFCKGEQQRKVKNCVGSCWGEKREPLREVVATYPTDNGEEESMMPISQSSRDEGGAGLPEENVEDQPSQEVSSDVLFSDNGKFVTQEIGKSSILSRQESQPQTFTD